VDALKAFNQQINERFDRLTKSEKKIAAYLMRNYEEAAFLSAADLAKRLEISEATVVRFAYSLDLSGYPQLRQQLQELVKHKISHAYRLRKKLAELSPEAHIFEQVMAMEMEYLTDAMRTISREAFDEAVRLICGAKRLFVYGLSGSATLAELLEHRLRRFGMEVVPLTQSGREVCEKLLMLTDEDVFFALLFFNLSEVMVSTLDYAKHCGCQVILLTDTLGPHLRDKVDVLLEARRGPVMAFHSLIVPMVIIQALILAVARADEETSMATLDRLDDIRERLNFVASVKI
jgi:DNA-binding MurR/RpiR family transcriptional regulator